MSSSEHPLQRLLGPLRYASARGFANLQAIKGLGDLLRKAVEVGEGSVESAVLSALRNEFSAVDAADPVQRRASVQRVVAAIAQAGLTLEGAVASATNVLAARPSAGPVSSQMSLTDTNTQTAPAIVKPPLASSRAASPVTPPAPIANRAPKQMPLKAAVEAPAKKTRPPKKPRPAAKVSEADSPATLLSIAPASGPLATLLKNIGWRINPRLVGQLNKKGVRKVGDILFLLPRVYEDRRHMRRISQLQTGERGTVVATVVRAEDQYGKNGRRTFRAVLSDSSGSISVTYFQTGPWLKAKFPIGKKLVVSGEVRQSPWGWEISHPEVEPADDLETSPIHFNRIVPVYSGFERHEQRVPARPRVQDQPRSTSAFRSKSHCRKQLRARLQVAHGLGRKRSRQHPLSDAADAQHTTSSIRHASRRLSSAARVR